MYCRQQREKESDAEDRYEERRMRKS